MSESFQDYVRKFSPDAAVLLKWIYEHHGIAVTMDAMKLAEKALEEHDVK